MTGMRWLEAIVLGGVLLAGCGKQAPKVDVQAPIQVMVMTVTPRDTPVSFEYVGQIQSSHQVEIRARVNGFLERRAYTEGSAVKAGDLLFVQDPKPFQAQLDIALGALAEQRARLQVANDNLAQVKPLAAAKALSQKDLDDAMGQRDGAAAAVQSAKASADQAKLNLGYTRIMTPISGVSSYARLQDGSYVSGDNNVLTVVEQLDPAWVNFSISENDMLGFNSEESKGALKMPANNAFVVEVILANGSVYQRKGEITFANASYNTQTGTFLLRATVPNETGTLRPGQFVRVRVSGPVRTKAILVPQEAVLQGATGHFVVLVDKDNKAVIRGVQTGPWQGDDWFITAGLQAGDVVITDGVSRVSPGTLVKIVQENARAGAVGVRPATATTK